MQESNQERIFIQVAVYTDPVIAEMSAVPVITQNTFTVPGDGKMDFITPQVLFNCMVSAGR